MVIALSACASNSPSDRKEYADLLAAKHGWAELVLPSGKFILAAYLPKAFNKSENLTIYFEGDGMAWISSSQPSLDPTPRSPVALELALRHPDHAVAYLARPCQYLRDRDVACKEAYWTEKRFAPEVVEASDLAVDALKQRFSARHLTFVGYSGGGAIAALVAARRSDVIRLVTVAGNLDHQAWTESKRVSPLTGSLNPADYWQRLVGIRQIHLVGGNDQVMDVVFAESYRARFPVGKQPEIIVKSGFDHRCCWVRDWADLASSVLYDRLDAVR
jgi:hypothetical protein